jgi:hypothetical protein
MRLIKELKIKETIVKFENKIYKRRKVEGEPQIWYISAGLEVNRKEYFWVVTRPDKSRDLESFYQLNGFN